ASFSAILCTSDTGLVLPKSAIGKPYVPEIKPPIIRGLVMEIFSAEGRLFFQTKVLNGLCFQRICARCLFINLWVRTASVYLRKVFLINAFGLAADAPPRDPIRVL